MMGHWSLITKKLIGILYLNESCSVSQNDFSILKLYCIKNVKTAISDDDVD